MSLAFLSTASVRQYLPCAGEATIQLEGTGHATGLTNVDQNVDAHVKELHVNSPTHLTEQKLDMVMGIPRVGRAPEGGSGGRREGGGRFLAPEDPPKRRIRLAHKSGSHVDAGIA